MSKQSKSFALSLALSLGVGGLSAFLIRNNLDTFDRLIQPPLTPPAMAFGIVWIILYLLMGISAYLIYQSNSHDKNEALVVYAEQLVVNFFWPILFFNLQWRLAAFFWLLLLLLHVFCMIKKFYKLNKWAAYLQIPYLLWIIYAGYLNLGFYALNK